MPLREIVAFAMIAAIAVLLASLWLYATRERRAYQSAIRARQKAQYDSHRDRSPPRPH
jgi:hypothetical protein